MLANLSNEGEFSEIEYFWYYKLFPVPSDYVAIKAFVKSDPLLVS